MYDEIEVYGTICVNRSKYERGWHQFTHFKDEGTTGHFKAQIDDIFVREIGITCYVNGNFGHNFQFNHVCIVLILKITEWGLI